jgi:hypothetical protein
MAEVGLQRHQTVAVVQCGIARDQVHQLGLNFEGDNLARMADRGNCDRDDTASGAEFQYAIAGTDIREAREQNRIDIEAIAINGLHNSQCTAEDRIGCFGRAMEDMRLEKDNAMPRFSGDE